MSDITKRAMSAALKNLLKEKKLNKITVQDIADECGINRQTFYYHFQDIYDLVEWTCIEDTEKVLKENRTYDTWQEGFLSVFDLAKKDKTFIDNIYRSVSLEMLEQYLYRLVCHNFPRGYKKFYSAYGITNTPSPTPSLRLSLPPFKSMTFFFPPI